MAETTEIREEFAALEEWQQFAASHPAVFDPAFIDRVADQIRASGLYFTFGDEHVPPASVAIDGDNYRETIVYRGLNSRQRAVLEEILRCLGDRHDHSCKIYSLEAFSAFALLLRSRYPRFIGSEYTDDPKLLEAIYPVPIENLLSLSFKSDSFHVVAVNDVFEHVPDIPRVLGEIARILEPGGSLVSTFPFHPAATGIEKARLTAHGIEYLTEPEYHGDPINPGGALVFKIPGWDILDECRAARFSEARMVYVLSQSRGILAPQLGGVFVLVARK